MEACGASHYWARELTKLGHTPKIMASKYVAPFRTGTKNDLNDAVAICTAVSRPSTRFVRIKSADQQAILLLHRARDHWVHERAALLNQIRVMLADLALSRRKDAMHYKPLFLKRLKMVTTYCLISPER